MISILCVDDEQDLLEVAQLFLEESGEFKVGISASAKDALTSASIASYDAIISDYQMPGMNGIEFLKEVRRRFGDIPFILFTGRGREEVVIEAINNGADFYLQKGGEPEAQFAELAHKIRQAVARRRAEHQRTESEKRLLDIINFLPDATFAIDKSGHVISWNRAMEEMTGRVAGEMLGKGEYEYAVPFYGMRRPILIDLVFSSPDEIRKRYSSVQINREILTGETVDATPKGKTCILWGMAAPLYNNEGAIVGAIESIRDITERRQAEEALRESERTLRINEERLVMAQEIGYIGSWEYKLNTDTIWGSAEGLRIFGFPPVAGDHPIAEIEACIPDRERVHQALVDLITKGDAYNIEYGINPADGSSPRVIHAMARLETDAGGNLIRIRGVIQDITGRKRGEDEIAFKNIILSTQQETTLDAILIVDENGKILNYNQNFIRIWGVPDSLIAAREDAPVLHYVNEQLADPDAFLSRVRYLYDHKEEKSFEELPLKDGRVLERFSSPMLGEGGRYFGRVWYFRDISERKQAEEKTRDSETRFSRLYTNMTEGTALHTLIYDETGIPVDYVIVETNPAFERHLGIPRDRVIGKTSREAYGVAEPPYLERYTRVALTGEPEIFETYFPPLDRYFSISAYCPAKGSFATIFEDITARKKADVALRESEARYRDLAELLPQMVFELDTEFRITYANRRTLAVFGFTEEDIEAGINALSFISPSQHADIREIVQKQLAGISFEPREYTAVRKDGSTFPVIIYSSPIYKDNSCTGFRGVVVDISARKKMEDGIREREEKFRSIFENSPYPIAINSIPDNKFLEVNKAFLDISGYTDAEIRGRDPIEMGFLPLTEALRLISHRLLTGKIENVPLAVTAKDGKRVHVLFSTMPITINNKPAIVTVTAEVTKLKRVEEELLQKNEDLHAAFEQLTANEEELRQNYEELQKNERVLRESEQKFSTVFQGSPIALTLVSAADGTFADVNEAFVRNTGYSRDDVIGNTAEQLGLFPDSDEREALIAALRSRREIQGMDLSCRIRSGEIRACLFSSRMILMGETPHILSTIEDITGRRETEVALKESEEKFRRLAEHAPDMIYRMSLPAGNFEYVSPASLALTGYTPEEFYADPSIIRTLIHPAWQEYSQRQWTALLQGEVPPVYEYQIIDRAGTTHWINQRNMVVRDEHEQMVTLEAITTDITRQKEIERELKRNELRSLAVSENIGFWIWEIDQDGVLRYSSPAIRHILGYAPDELVGKMHFYDLFDAGVREEIKTSAFTAFDSHEPFRNFVNLNRHKNGTPVLLSTSGTPMFDETGAFSGYCGVDENITERTATQSAFQTIVRSMVGTTGITALHQITRSVSSWLDVPCVMIGEIQPDNQTVKVLSMLLDGNEVTDFSYTLKGTPCEDVAEKGFCLYEDNVRQLFPHSKDLVDLNIRGYIGTPMRNSAGQVFGILCALSHTPFPSVPSMQDIMDIIAVKAAAELERMQMERALTENRQMLGDAMDMAHLTNWEYDVASGMFTFDDRFYTLYGTTTDREGGNLMSGDDYSREFVHPDDRHMIREAVEQAMTTTDPNYTARAEHRIIRRDGELRYIVVRLGITKDAEGRTIKTHGVNQDITDIWKAEESLRETKEKFRSLVETTPGVIWEVDSRGQFQYISPIVKTLLGYAPDELIGESVTVLVIERLQPTVMKILENFISSPDMPLQPFEIIARHRDGHDLVMEIRPSRVTDPHGVLIGFRGVAYDTTERKKAEEALKRANRQLTLMSSITRHDLLNKITVILGNLKLAERKSTDPGQEEYLKKIRYATSAIKAQIEFTRIYQNLGTNEPQWLNLDSMMPRSHVPDTMSLHAEVRGIQIHADPMLERVFFNLLDNSIRHGETVTEIHVSSHQSGSDLVVVWEDNGIGIAPEDKGQIFDRGFGKNTGLGLFLVREILSLTGITIRETGEPGKGARFEIVVPQGAYEFTAEQ